MEACTGVICPPRWRKPRTDRDARGTLTLGAQKLRSPTIGASASNAVRPKAQCSGAQWARSSKLHLQSASGLCIPPPVYCDSDQTTRGSGGDDIAGRTGNSSSVRVCEICSAQCRNAAARAGEPVSCVRGFANHTSQLCGATPQPCSANTIGAAKAVYMRQEGECLCVPGAPCSPGWAEASLGRRVGAAFRLSRVRGRKNDAVGLSRAGLGALAS
ncbi:hypothetical protein BV25DRAFT_504162 [Artomyces pyxidatus]|uniref:Uncharacterized protein n=1 Tax=Artomyces pyxidatus TaxID=48021 RepID=A0ACB8THS9_9AGAM|nr:hypothetical protein BV25DRAFT_504162 [Artomyces pyxidatus]